MGKISEDAAIDLKAIDLKESYLASISEDGQGVLNKIIYNSNSTGTKMTKQRARDSTDASILSSLNRGVSDSNKIIFEEVASF